MYGKAPMKIFSCRASRHLAEKIAAELGTELGKSSVTEFKDGEFQPCFDESVRGNMVFIVQSTNPPADNLFELLLMIDAAKRASAYKVIAVIPYFGFARQDRKDRPRVSIGSKLSADLLGTAGVDRIITMDLHADQIQGFFNVPVDHLYGSAIFAPYIENLKLENLTVSAPDMGGSKRANAYSRHLHTEMVLCYKLRKKPNVIEEMSVLGDVEGRNVIIIDDMVDTAGTLVLAAQKIHERGALSIRGFATHPILSGNAVERIENSPLTELVVTDSVPLKRSSSKIKVLTIAEILANTIQAVNINQSISTNFVF
ncbi:MAG TPA: ribose-phosphate pyrophosphokinase [Bacteroidales bacterium]|jgi:ribose-phosphate pyrophosphokinase|nr:ribose-phosphate pyrophosphokinase [Bacteroidales bacterium]MDI9552173.1 ribose-phosphate pyrophosphokinase [Bacteroidota bacterium]MBP7037538.1 ribose-phosphate pyrophosphokinase [Bacteroidales bacterium]MZP66331.1 ribose-phosphate diphosphokinase [Bacteroidales bacterium]NLK54203.1 ribose-phosphate pyrophosphokinase [Bacteroidales bacterium]